MKNSFNKTNSHKGGYASLMFELKEPSFSLEERERERERERDYILRKCGKEERTGLSSASPTLLMKGGLRRSLTGEVRNG